MGRGFESLSGHQQDQQETENVAQLVELQFVVLAVAGSIPVVLPSLWELPNQKSILNKSQVFIKRGSSHKLRLLLLGRMKQYSEFVPKKPGCGNSYTISKLQL